jgi:hypothetical protein
MFAVGAGVGAAVAATVLLLALPSGDGWREVGRAPEWPAPSAGPALGTSATPVASAPTPATAPPVAEAAASAAADEVAPARVPTAATPAPARSGAASDTPGRVQREWARHYHRPAECEGNPSPQQLIECGNHYIRSRREFEARQRGSAP